MTVDRTFRSGRKAVLGVLAAVALVALLLALPAFACTPSANVSVRPARAEAGSTVQFEGRTFDPEGFPVNVRWGGATGPLLATAVVDADGAFSIPVTVPADASGGHYLITATQRYPRRENGQIVRDASGDPVYDFKVVSATLEVPGAPASAPAPQPAPAPQEPQPPAEAVEPVPAAPVQAAQPAARPAAQSVQQAPPAQSAPAEPEPAPAEEQPAPVLQADPGTAPVQPLPSPGILFDGAPRRIDVGPSPWVIVPLALLGLAMFSIGTAAFVHEIRQRRVEAEI